jgi:Tex-like protein N-terminal domain/Tex central region-like
LLLGACERLTQEAFDPFSQTLDRLLRQLHCPPAHCSASMKPINLRIAEELGVREQQVAAATSLLDGGATVPFVARYRKEATGALDDARLRTLDERLRYLRELDERRAAILDSISQQGKLDSALKQAIDAAHSKARLEDPYLPYRPKRRTKAQMAREAGLEPLAEVLLARPDQNLQQVACRYVEAGKGVVDPTTALEGARAILVERFAEDATLIGILRKEVWSSTSWGLTSTRCPRPCCRESPASAKDWRQRRTGAQHCQLPGGARSFSHSRGPQEGTAARAQGFRAFGRIPAHLQRRRSARRVGRTPGSLPGSEAHSRGNWRA